MPRHLGVTPQKVIAETPYIKAEPTLVAKWRSLIATSDKLVVGINWQGGRELEQRTYPGRSIDLDKFRSILSSDDISFISLQKGFGSEQVDTYSLNDKFVNVQKQIDEAWDFQETVAIVESCDLVITCDTSMAHLAGAMGKTVWTLLKHVPIWTWGLASSKTAWYPSMRLFRQPKSDDWDSVIETVEKELKMLSKSACGK